MSIIAAKVTACLNSDDKYHQRKKWHVFLCGSQVRIIFYSISQLSHHKQFTFLEPSLLEAHKYEFSSKRFAEPS